MKVRDAKLALLIGIGLLLSGPIAYATVYGSDSSNNNSVTITPSGTIATVCTVTLGNPVTSLGDLTVAGSVKIGIVTESCNDATGYKVNLTSANKGTLKGTSGSSFAYTLGYGSTPSVDLSSGFATVTNVNAPTSSPVSKDVNVSWQAQTALVADSYSDTLTFTMAAN